MKYTAILLAALSLVACEPVSHPPQGSTNKRPTELYRVTHYLPNAAPKVYETNEIQIYSQSERVSFKAVDGIGYTLFGTVEIAQLK